MKKLVYVGFSFNHHGLNSGYDQIKFFVNFKIKINCQKEYDFIQLVNNSRSIFGKFYTKFFGFRLWFTELKLILLSILKPRNLVFHIIYGENIYKFLGLFKFRNKIVLTLHQPSTYFLVKEHHLFLKYLKYVDKIIVMSKDMELFFKNKFPEIEIQYIPHGVDTSFFIPKGTKKDQILLIGNWLRDFEFASKVFLKLELLMPDVEIKIITNVHNHKYFLNNKVKCLSNINDMSLLKLYQESKVLFLPLTDFTANNAALEALSSGNIVIISSNSKNFEKLENNSVFYTCLNVDEVVSVLKSYLQNFNPDYTINTRKFVLNNYSWDIIGRKTEMFLLKDKLV